MGLPFFPFRLTESQPTMFCPMSRIYFPSGRSKTATGFNVSCTRIFGFCCAVSLPAGASITSGVFHAPSSKPFVFQPSISRRASYSSPSNSLFATIGPFEVIFQDVSLTTVACDPSAYSIRSCASKRGKPNVFIPGLRIEKKRPFPKITPNVFLSEAIKAVTSYTL